MGEGEDFTRLLAARVAIMKVLLSVDCERDIRG